MQGVNIVITTLQKFPFILDKIGTLPERRYALIVDEAHSSQGGETVKEMKQALTTYDMSRLHEDRETYEASTEDSDTVEDEIRRQVVSRGAHPNLSFFAFTATPKPRTLELFGVPNGNERVAFHTYSMRQAIEEGFILDVLQNHIHYQTFFNLSREVEDDPRLNKKRAARAIARFVSLHPHNLAQKTEVIIEHFRQCVMNRIGGKAKAMVVTSSRPHVVRYKAAFDTYIKEMGYSDVRALVAFTAFTDIDTGVSYSEVEMNGFGERELPRQFEDNYNLLLVADKYQTGFDQPLLHTMYVDKKLSGVRAVQTLSRLNRICAGKTETFVLDFANTEDEMREAFQLYYEQTTLAETTDPNKLYDLKGQLEESQVIWTNDIEGFAQIFFKQTYTNRDHGKLNSAVDPAVERFKKLPETAQDDFKNALTVFVRLYAFLAQIMPFSDVELEKFYVFGRYLLTKLPKQGQGAAFVLDDEVALEYYRLQKINEGDITLETQGQSQLNPLSEAGNRREKEEKALLSEIIDLLNSRFGTDFTDADRLFFDQIEQELLQDETLSQQAQSNSIDNFRYGFEESFLDKLIERMDQNQEIFARIIDDSQFGEAVREWMLQKVYARFNKET